MSQWVVYSNESGEHSLGLLEGVQPSVGAEYCEIGNADRRFRVLAVKRKVNHLRNRAGRITVQMVGLDNPDWGNVYHDVAVYWREPL